MKFAKFLLATALSISCAVLVNQVQAAAWTFTTTGTIGKGSDATGIFFGDGSNHDLAGMKFTMTTMIDPSLQTNVFIGSVETNSNGNNAIPYSEAVTINNVTKTFSGVTNGNNGFSVSQLFTDGQLYGNNNLNRAAQLESGYTADDTTLYGEQLVQGTSYFGLGLEFDQVWSYTPNATDFQFSYFLFRGQDGNVMFETEGGNTSQVSKPAGGTVTNISINESTVPEPGSLALLGAALVGFIAVRRRRYQ